MTEIKRRRKPGDLQREKAAVALGQAVATFVLNHGGKMPPVPKWAREGDASFTLPTSAGALEINIHYDDPHSVFMRFEDTEKAVAKLGLHSALNPYSGKWNLHLYPAGWDRRRKGITPLASMMSALERHLAPVLGVGTGLGAGFFCGARNPEPRVLSGTSAGQPTKAKREALIKAYALMKFSGAGMVHAASLRTQQKFHDRYMKLLISIGQSYPNLDIHSDAFRREIEDVATSWWDSRVMKGVGVDW